MTQRGRITARIHEAKDLVPYGSDAMKATVTLKFKSMTATTKASTVAASVTSFEEQLIIDVDDIGPGEKVEFLVNHISLGGEIKLIGRGYVPSMAFTKKSLNREWVELGNYGSILVSLGWSPKPTSSQATLQSNAAPSKREIQQVNKAVAFNPCTDVRPWFLRLSYYYEGGKRIYTYTTGIRGIATIAKYGENTTNFVLSKVGYEPIKSTASIDGNLTPLLEKVDTKVDEKIHDIAQVLLKGQNYVLSVKDKSVEKISDLGTVTRTKVSNATNSSVQSLSHAKDTTVATVARATKATYHTVAGVTSTVISYIPIIGKRHVSVQE